MRFLPTLLMFALCLAGLPAAELATSDGKTVTYDSIDCDPATPRSAIVLKEGERITTLRLSQVAIKALPAEIRAKVEAFTAKQRQAGLVLLDDEWVDRDGHLLKSDERFAYPRKLRPLGNNRFTLDNKGARRITVGVRPVGEAAGKQRGLEVSVQPDKQRTIQLPDGEYTLLVVSEVDGGAELDVSRTDPIKLTKHHYTLVVGIPVADGLTLTPAGRIAVPEAMRR